MKNFAIILVAMAVLIGGCQTTTYIYESYKIENGRSLLEKHIEVKNNKACVNTETTNLQVIIDPNGRASLGAGKIIVIADPNSAKAIGEAIGHGAIIPFGL
ncbi:MAG: hypothetical protein JW947_08390 [Sedimentisphaerales bacterium]|nr:hypothetical protein [Sedimentisphaerales bacterium]